MSCHFLMVKSFQNMNLLFWTILNDIGIIKYLTKLINRAFFSFLTSHCPFPEDILEMSVRKVCTVKVKNMYAKLIFGTTLILYII